jgi:hypothetical protein
MESVEMKKVLCLLISLVLCIGMVMPVLAAENSFVPSVTYKDGPGVTDATMNDEDVDDCVVVTTIEEAENKSTDISQDDRDLLLEVYEELKNGNMELPLEDDYVIRDLVDVSFEYEDCREIEEHGHKDEKLKEEGVTLTVTFELGVGPYEDVVVVAYIDGQWVVIEDVTNNGDGTVTCVFEDICPVAFAVKEKSGANNPATGDQTGNQMVFFVGAMVLSAAGIVALLATKARKAR